MLHQPKALSVFFLTEMWERYGFYIIQTLLVLYLIRVFQRTDDFSYGVLGSVTALAYGNSVIGGYIADRLIGHRSAVLLAAVMLSIGYSLLAVSNDLNLVFWAIALTTMGTGLLKPNVSSMVGALYEKNDVRRHSGFTLFYVGINLGIILGTTLAGVIQEYFGWHTVFLSAAFVLLIALAIFYWGTRHFKIGDICVIQKSGKNWIIGVLMMILMVILSEYIIAHQEIALLFFFAVAIASAAVVVYEAFHEQGLARHRLMAYLILAVISTVYWAIYFQMFFSMNLFVARVVDRSMFGITVVPGVFPSIEALAVIFFGPLLGALWLWLQGSRARFNPSIPMKFTLALMMNAIAFGALFLSSVVLNHNGMVMPGWLIFVYIVIGVGELLLSPIGLAMVTELVPQRLVGTMMGIFFISLGLGGKLAGVFADLSAIPQTMTSVPMIVAVYHHTFLIYFIVCLGAALASLALVPTLKRLIVKE